MSNCSASGVGILRECLNRSKTVLTEEMQGDQEVDTSRIIQHIAWIVFGLMICACNWLTMAILTRMPRLSANHTTMHLLLGNLALADSIVGVTLLLLTGIEMHSSAHRHSCLAIYGLFMLSAGESTTTLTLLAQDRYKAIVYPLGHRARKGDIEKTVRNLVITWSFWCIVGLLPILPVIALTDNPLSHECRLVVDIQKWHVVIAMVVLHGLLYIFILFYHVQVVRTIRSKNRIFPHITSSTTTPYAAARMRQHVTLTCKVIFITVLFSLCWIPFQIMITIFTICPHDFKSNDDVHCGISGNKFTVPATMATMNSLMNSFVYIFAFKKFRQTLKGMIRCSRKGQNAQQSDSSVPAVTDQSGANQQIIKPTDFSQLTLPIKCNELSQNR